MKAFIFDFDGVIMDSQRHWDDGVVDVYKRTFPTLKADKDEFLGRSEKDVFAMLKDDGHAPARSDEDHWKEIHGYATSVYERAPIVPGVIALMERLQKLDVLMGIATSSTSTWIIPCVERRGIRQFVSTIATADQVPFAKPHPDVYLLAADRLGIDPRECIALEDSENGMTAAKGAGMYGIGFIPHGNPSRIPNADMHVRDFEELSTEWLEKMFP